MAITGLAFANDQCVKIAASNLALCHLIALF